MVRSHSPEDPTLIRSPRHSQDINVWNKINQYITRISHNFTTYSCYSLIDRYSLNCH
jgi:hypothetical protein